MATKIMPVSDLRRKISQTIKELQHAARDEVVYITQHGRPQAVLVSYDHYEYLREQARRQITSKDIEAIQSDPAAIRPAAGSLAEALQNAAEDPQEVDNG